MGAIESVGLESVGQATVYFFHTGRNYLTHHMAPSHVHRPIHCKERAYAREMVQLFALVGSRPV